MTHPTVCERATSSQLLSAGQSRVVREPSSQEPALASGYFLGWRPLGHAQFPSTLVLAVLCFDRKTELYALIETFFICYNLDSKIILVDNHNNLVHVKIKNKFLGREL